MENQKLTEKIQHVLTVYNMFIVPHFDTFPPV